MEGACGAGAGYHVCGLGPEVMRIGSRSSAGAFLKLNVFAADAAAQFQVTAVQNVWRLRGKKLHMLML